MFDPVSIALAWTKRRSKVSSIADIYRQRVNLKLRKLDLLWERKKWLSKLDKTKTKNLLLDGQKNHQVLVLIAPIAIDRDLDLPQVLRDSLSKAVKSKVETFLIENYSLHPDAPVECLNDYLKEPISDLRVRQLFTVLEPMTTIVLYAKLQADKLTLQVAYWNIWREKPEIDFDLSLTLDWKAILKTTFVEDLNRLLRAIAELHCLAAAFPIDLHYWAIDTQANYQPHLLNLEAEFKTVVAGAWKKFAAVFQKIQEVRWKTYDEWHKRERRWPEIRSSWTCRTFQDDSEGFSSFCYSPDGKTLACRTRNGNIKLLDATTGECNLTIESHSDPISLITYSPDGQTLACGTNNGTVRLLNAMTGECYRTLGDCPTRVDSIQYSPDSKTIAFSFRGCDTIKLWNIATGECQQTLPNSGYLKAYSPNGRTLVSQISYRGENIVKLWDTQTDKCLYILSRFGSYFKDNCSHVLAYSPDGYSLAIRGVGGKGINILNIETGQNSQLTSQEFYQFTYSPDGKTLAVLTVSNGNEIQLWNVMTGECYRILTEPRSSKWREVFYSPDGKKLSCVGSQGIVFWNVETGEYYNLACGGSSHSYSPDGRDLACLAYGCPSNVIKIWSILKLDL
ncbi:hypothetical protein POG22_01585 [Geitlerinema sp. CS-897]|nr:hypothetical protein [Geitlerinema sp. CS-897]